MALRSEIDERIRIMESEKSGWEDGTKSTEKWHEIIKRGTRRKRTLKDVDDDERGADKRKKKK